MLRHMMQKNSHHTLMELVQNVGCNEGVHLICTLLGFYKIECIVRNQSILI